MHMHRFQNQDQSLSLPDKEIESGMLRLPPKSVSVAVAAAVTTASTTNCSIVGDACRHHQQQEEHHPHQLLVRFQDRTYPVDLLLLGTDCYTQNEEGTYHSRDHVARDDEEAEHDNQHTINDEPRTTRPIMIPPTTTRLLDQQIIEYISYRTGWPCRFLRVVQAIDCTPSSLVRTATRPSTTRLTAGDHGKYEDCYQNIIHQYASASSYTQSSSSSTSPLLYDNDFSLKPLFCTVKVISSIRGGKGGFGTLLKGQSRMAGAKTTTDFGACRDLQGRRLRHINEQQQHRIYEHYRKQIQAGTATEADLIQAIMMPSATTRIGESSHGSSSAGGGSIPGWHLPVPAWSDVSLTKERRQAQRQFRQWVRQKDAIEQIQREKRLREQQQSEHYMRITEQAQSHVRDNVQAAVKQGLLAAAAAAAATKKTNITTASVIEPIMATAVDEAAAAATTAQEKTQLVVSLQEHSQHSSQQFTSSSKKRKAEEPEPPSGLITLAGDVTLAYVDNRWQIQSPSNFCTIGMMFRDAIRHIQDSGMTTTNTSYKNQFDSNCCCYYYEVKVVTGGLVQLGWASPLFRPCSETGDGVGDDVHSWSYDGSRCIRLHGGGTQKDDSDDHTSTTPSSSPYGGPNPWKAGDVIGCMISHHQLSSEISYTINGHPLGVAFEIPAKKHTETNSTSNNNLDDEQLGKDSNSNKTTMDDGPSNDILRLRPAISCNPQEVVELRLDSTEMQYLPLQAIPIGQVLAYEEDMDEEEDRAVDHNSTGEQKQNVLWERHALNPIEDVVTNPDLLHRPLQTPHEEQTLTNSSPETIKAPTLEPLNLDDYTSAKDLERVGLDELKRALTTRGVKCGGTLQQRAERLFSLQKLHPKDYPAKLLAKKKAI